MFVAVIWRIKCLLVEKEVHVLTRNLVQMEKIAMCVLLDPN